MRRWELVEGSTSKFWETGAEGAVVTVRYGRCGSDGRTRSKEYASPEAAAAQIARAIGEKEKKGYREVGSPDAAATPPPRASDAPVPARGPVVLPDEDTFVLPAEWKRVAHPRRGGAHGAPVGRQPETHDLLDARIADEAAWIEEFVRSPRSDPSLAEALRAHLDGSPSPLGAAALTAILNGSGWAEYWTARYGLPFAARAATEVFSVDADWRQGRRSRTDHRLRALPGPRQAHWAWHHRAPIDRVRALLAVADEDVYRATVEALAPCRTDTLRTIVVSYLVPGETGWVDELCTDPGVGAEQDRTLRSMVFSSLYSADQLALLPYAPDFTLGLAMIATVAEGVGTAVAGPLAASLGGSHYYADSMKLAAEALAEIPTDEAFLGLLAHAGSKHVRPSLLDAMRRYPVRAVRLLASAASGRSATASWSSQLLRSHVGARREVVSAALESLAPEVVRIVEPLLNPVGLIPDAPLDALPPLLAAPPWSRPRTAAKPTVVPGLTPVSEPRVAWLPGERESWASASSWYTGRRGDLAGTLDAVRRDPSGDGLRPAWAFVHGPRETVAPLLAVWDPTDLWEGEDTLRPIAARFGPAALPLLVRAVPRQPGPLAPLLLPFVDVQVARLMADWAVRLKSTATTARSWFARHGVAAAPLLVPDAVGRAGAARRAAEQALALIASVHGDDVVRGAARTYGAQAAAAVEELLSVDPLERALPARMPVLPDWADPAVLPQIVVRSGGALPAAAVRHALMALALSKPDEVYPGVAALTGTATAASLAEFAWALFEQWRLANMPAKESWALHALGLLGDDGTVRLLTPIVRSWPGEGAHHRAVEGLDVLASIGSDVALLHLHGISQRVKFKALKVRAQEKIAEVAAGLGLTGEQLADRLVPDFGLDADGSTVVDYGTRSFRVGFDEQLRPYVLDGDGKRRKDLPKPGARDDAELAPAERKRFMALKKDVRTVAPDQVRRLEAAMVGGRSWTAQEFRELFVGHPLLGHLVRRLVWLSGAEDAGPVAFRVAEDGTFTDVEDAVFALPDGAAVRLAHPLHLGDALTAWSEVFAGHGILQPFPQLGRAVFTLAEEESGAYRLPGFEGVKVPVGKVLGLERRGWRRGVPQDAGVERWISKRLANDCYLVVALNPGIAAGVVDMFPEQTLETVWLDDRPDDHWQDRDHTLRFAGLDPVTLSELLGDLTGLTAGMTP
ncbi:DUF4132 domain-containing protein [Streptomyces sp. NPDC002225]|uniref:WGR and DUF4132 domain-containing protein n=1 Tax=Streptomyces sp. NPDC002225 TaxID=3154413 RepID=UPI00332315F2